MSVGGLRALGGILELPAKCHMEFVQNHVCASLVAQDVIIFVKELCFAGGGLGDNFN